MLKTIKSYWSKGQRKSIQSIIKVLLLIGNTLKITTFTKEIDRTKVFNRTLVLIDEGEKRGIQTEVLIFFSHQTRFFKSSHQQKEIIYDSLPLGNSYLACSLDVADNKWLTKKLLRKHNLPTPEGKVFLRLSQTLQYAKKLGFPLVTKPVTGSLSKNVTFNIESENQLINAIKHAKDYERFFLVEQHIHGHNYRILVVDGKIVGGVLRHPAYVMGNGKNTIKRLVEIKNQHPLRGEKEQKNTTLHKIIIDQEALETLVRQKLNFQSIPKKGQKVYLHYKVNAASGADIHDVTEKIHPDNQQVFIKTAEIFDSKLIGIDFIAPDISQSYKKQKCGIIEVNTIPYIDLHHHPLVGKSRNAAGAIWDMVFGEK